MPDNYIPLSAAAALAFVVVALVMPPIKTSVTTTTTTMTRNVCDVSLEQRPTVAGRRRRRKLASMHRNKLRTSLEPSSLLSLEPSMTTTVQLLKTLMLL
jgi:hypothetical protein